MKLFRRHHEAQPPRSRSFGAWVLHQVVQGDDTRTLPFSRVEQLCSNAASLICGAVHADPASFGPPDALDADAREEAALVARRTADGFKASLADRENAILAWPWDHIATRAAWLGSRDSRLGEDDLGRAIDRIGTAYALIHREQLGAVITLWTQVAAAVARTKTAPDLGYLGSEMLRAFRMEAA